MIEAVQKISEEESWSCASGNGLCSANGARSLNQEKSTLGDVWTTLEVNVLTWTKLNRRKSTSPSILLKNGNALGFSFSPSFVDDFDLVTVFSSLYFLSIQ